LKWADDKIDYISGGRLHLRTKRIESHRVWSQVAIFACQQEAALTCLGVSKHGQYAVDGSQSLTAALASK
jgi:hypothetical protein